MAKAITFIPERCTGCRTCELACSLQHTRTCNPTRSRIRLLKRCEYLIIPIRCRQCEDPICVRVCPFRAIRKNEDLGFVEVDFDVCVGCKLCVEFCPFGGVQIDFTTGRIAICNLCEGEPACAKLCTANALKYVELEEMALKRRDDFFKIYLEFMKAHEGTLR